MHPTPHSKKRFLLSLAVLLAPVAAWAHPGHGSSSGFISGLLHPVSGLDHVLAMIAVGLWAVQLGGRAVFLLPLGFVASLGLGAFFGSAGLPFAMVEPIILASVFLLGFFLCMAVRPRLWVGMALVSIFGLFHGHAHGSEIPMAVSGLTYGVGFAAASLAFHGVGLGAGLLMRHAGSAFHTGLLRLSGLPVLAGGLYLAAI